MSNDTLAKPATQWAIGASGERLGSMMAKQSVSTFETYGTTLWANNTAPAGLAQAEKVEKAFAISKLTSTEIAFRADTFTVVVTGIFNLTLLTGTPATLWDLLNINSNFSNAALVTQDYLFDLATSQRGIDVLAGPMSLTRWTSAGFIRNNQLEFTEIYAGNDVYYTGSTGAATGNTHVPHLYGGNNVFVQGDKYATSTAYPDFFYGGSGINTTILPGLSSNYKITASNSIWNDMTQQSNLSGYMITDNTKAINTLGVNSMTYVQFADKTIKLSDMSTVAAPVTTTRSAVYMGSSDSVTVVDSGTTIYGGKGTETITLANYNTAQSAFNSLGAVPFSNFIHNVTIDQNVSQINLPMPSFFYEFKSEIQRNLIAGRMGIQVM